MSRRAPDQFAVCRLLLAAYILQFNTMGTDPILHAGGRRNAG